MVRREDRPWSRSMGDLGHLRTLDAIELDEEFPDGEEHYRVNLAAIAPDTLMTRCPTCGRWDGSHHTC